ncbi:MAG TPA: CvpA family protein [Phycisphaerae bacterium]|nr:CvpA family protein [Phycisphaerae bacterium]
MILNPVSLLLILLLAAYLGNQGTLSALLAFIGATFASLLAAAFFEPLQRVISGWRPDYARGITFLLLFFLAFSACRIAADMTVIKNVRMPKILDRSVGFVFGFLAAMVVIGSTLIGIQMLPLGTDILGYDRFGSSTGMRVEGDPTAVASGSNIWLAPDNFTVGIWNLALGRALGGDQAFANAHPNFLVECYGYRQSVQTGASTALPPDLMSVPAAWVSSNPDILKQFDINDPDKAVVMVRAQISQGSDPPKSSVNMGASGDAAKPYFFITPTQIRLVTDKPKQYYPIGYLERGTTLVLTPYDAGQLADDFPKDKDKVIEDWLFEINKDEHPKFVEVKQLAKVDLAGILKDTPTRAESAAAYAPRTSRAEQSTLTVHVAGMEGGHNDNVKVYVVSLNTTIRVAKPLIGPSYDENLKHLQDINSGNGTIWLQAQGKPGVPNTGQIESAHRMLQNPKNDSLDTTISWHDFLQYLFVGECTPDGPRNLVVLPQYFESQVLPVMTPSIIKQGVTDSSGKVDLPEIPKGSYDVVAVTTTDKGFYFWVETKQVAAKTADAVELTPENASFSAVLK